MTTLVIAEHDNTSVKAATLNTVTAAVQISMFLDAQVHVLVAGHNAGEAAAAAAQITGVTKVLHIEAETLAHGLAENLTAQILSVAGGYSHVLFPATASGKNVAPRLAAKLDVGQISDVTNVLGSDTFERPIYAGNAIAIVQSTDAIKVLTVRTTGFDAAALSGSIGASRAAVDAGYAANDLQVGQTGKIVAPQLYIAAGISGAIQHLAGMKDSKVIVAINKDPEAPIFSVADYGLEADLFVAVPEFVAAL